MHHLLHSGSCVASACSEYTGTPRHDVRASRGGTNFIVSSGAYGHVPVWYRQRLVLIVVMRLALAMVEWAELVASVRARCTCHRRPGQILRRHAHVIRAGLHRLGLVRALMGGFSFEDSVESARPLLHKRNPWWGAAPELLLDTCVVVLTPCVLRGIQSANTGMADQMPLRIDHVFVDVPTMHVRRYHASATLDAPPFDPTLRRGPYLSMHTLSGAFLSTAWTASCCMLGSRTKSRCRSGPGSTCTKWRGVLSGRAPHTPR